MKMFDMGTKYKIINRNCFFYTYVLEFPRLREETDYQRRGK